MTAARKLDILRWGLFASGIVLAGIGIHLLLLRMQPGHTYSHPQQAFWASLFFQWYGSAMVALSTLGWKGLRVRHQRPVAAESLEPHSPA